MRDLTGKVNNGGETQAGRLDANEFNDMAQEDKNLIVATGQTLSSSDLKQKEKAVAAYSTNGGFAVESGSADAYVLEPISGRTRVQALQDGMRFYSETSNVNTGASTVNVHNTGVKDIVSSDGSALTGGEISGRFEVEYDSSEDEFVLVSVSGLDDSEKIELKSGRKNLLINGNFDIWQRGNSFTSGYCADRWIISGVSTVDRNSTGSPQGSIQNARIERNATGTAQISQRIESINAVAAAGKKITFSFWHGQNTGTVNSIDIIVSRPSTSSDDFSSLTQIQSINITDVSTGVKEVTFDAMPSEVNLGLELKVSYNMTGATDCRLTRAQLEVGEYATNFEYYFISEETTNCERYFISIAQLHGTAYPRITGSVTENRHYVFQFNTTMRVAPTALNVVADSGASVSPTKRCVSFGWGSVGANNAKSATSVDLDAEL